MAPKDLRHEKCFWEQRLQQSLLHDNYSIQHFPVFQKIQSCITLSTQTASVLTLKKYNHVSREQYKPKENVSRIQEGINTQRLLANTVCFTAFTKSSTGRAGMLKRSAPATIRIAFSSGRNKSMRSSSVLYAFKPSNNPCWHSPPR